MKVGSHLWYILIGSVLDASRAIPIDESTLAVHDVIPSGGVLDNSPTSAVTQTDHRTEAHQFATQVIGGPHGEYVWSDEAMIRDGTHHRLKTIKMYCGERVDGVQFGFADLEPNGGKIVTKWTPIHGQDNGGTIVTVNLDYWDYVTAIKLSVVKYSRGLLPAHSRIGYMEISTKLGAPEIGCGTKTASLQEFSVDTGKNTLLYMSGTSGEGLDSLQGHFIPIADYARFGPQH